MFENILGNENNKQILNKSLQSNKTSHSYLFCGIEGIGKKRFAEDIAQFLLCQNPQDIHCCDVCKSCVEFNTNNNPDFFLIEANDGKIKIDQIREMHRKIAEKPIISERKVYIIDNADQMTTEAQNCLLKTLEEPPEYATIILICSNENSMLNTIKSRCTRIYFLPIEQEEIKEFIQKNYNQEMDKDILELAQGSIGKAIKILDNQEMYINLKNILSNMSKDNLIDVVQNAEMLYKTKDEINSIIEYINVLLLKFSKDNKKYLSCISIVEDTKKRLKANSNYDMCIDNMLFNIWYEMNKK